MANLNKIYIYGNVHELYTRQIIYFNFIHKSISNNNSSIHKIKRAIKIKITVKLFFLFFTIKIAINFPKFKNIYKSQHMAQSTTNNLTIILNIRNITLKNYIEA